jgi:hypothetical protein
MSAWGLHALGMRNDTAAAIDVAGTGHPIKEQAKKGGGGGANWGRWALSAALVLIRC